MDFRIADTFTDGLARLTGEGQKAAKTFSDTLGHALRIKLRRLPGNTPRLGERIEVHAMNAIGEGLQALQFGRPASPPRTKSAACGAASAAHPEHRFSTA